MILTERKTIGLYGGSFNPPHVAHVCTVAWALSVGEVDEVWAIPTGGHPFGKDLAPFEDRIEMCKLAFALFGDRVSVLDIEREDRVHYSIDTTKSLIKQNAGRAWRWIIGSDALAQSADWRNFEELNAIAPMLVIGRAGHPARLAGPNGNSAASAPEFMLPDVSSTFIRVRLAAGDAEAVRGVLPKAVLEYIKRGGLYGAHE